MRASDSRDHFPICDYGCEPGRALGYNARLDGCGIDQLRILQVLPELNAGGVERGTVEFARYLVTHGHSSWVMSAGGGQVATLVQQGSKHVQLPVHRKSLLSLRHVSSVARAIDEISPDVIHVRSRLPAWLVYLAVGLRPRQKRPAIVSTFHGLYSVNPYSAIMAKADAVIAVSQCVKDYIVHNYPKIQPDKITVVHRGVDTQQFNDRNQPSRHWLAKFDKEFQGARAGSILLMPGRLSRWKGQLEFIQLLAQLKLKGIQAHGFIVGAPTPGKDSYQAELQDRVKALRLQDRVTFLGHRADMAELYAISTIVFNLSQRPEPFGRTVIEALAMGTPVVSFNIGGPAESLALALPEGLVAPGDAEALVAKVVEFIEAPPSAVQTPEFTLQVQAEKTLAIYQSLVNYQ